MSTNELPGRVQECVDEFVGKVEAIARAAALNSVKEAFEALAEPVGVPVAGNRAYKKVAKTNGKPEKVEKTTRPKVGSSAKSEDGTRVKRSAEDIEKIRSQILKYVKANPGARADAVAASVQMTTKELQLPMKSLVKDGVLSQHGQKRGTTYSA